MVQATFTIDQLIQFRYKSLLSKQLNELKALKRVRVSDRDKKVELLLNKHKDELYEAINADKEVFLRKDSVMGYLERYY